MFGRLGVFFGRMGWAKPKPSSGGGGEPSTTGAPVGLLLAITRAS